VSGDGTKTDLPALAFARSAGTPAAGEIQFYDGHFPALTSGTYKITAKQSVALDSAKPYEATQEFEIAGPRFTLDPGVAETTFPPDSGNGEYDEELPFVVLADPSLPWERSIVPGGPAPTAEEPTPWLALALFAEGEVELQPGTSSPLATISVKELLTSSDEVLGPQIKRAELSEAELKSACQAITVPGRVFTAAMPNLEELPSLAHCRAVNAGEGEALLSILLANRLPQASGKPLRFYAHLVSLEGFHDYLGPNGKPLPAKVRLASLLSWSFVSQPKAAVDFEALVESLIAHQKPTAGLALSAPEDKPLPEPAAGRIGDGYAPLGLTSGAGEQSFAWYRGPFSPVVPQALPEVGEPPVAASEARSADALAIYIAEQGLFDLSYAAAWNAGRQLALADAKFTQAMARLRRQARGALGQLAQRMSAPHLAGAEPAALLAGGAARSRFAEQVGSGLASRWTEALAGARAGEAAPAAAGRVERPRQRAAVHPRDALAQPATATALGDALEELLQPVGAWLAKLSLLGSVPFSHLVPNAAMLPPESVRFFYVDRDWIDTLLAGATSIGVEAAADVALLKSLRPRLAQIVAEKGGLGLEGAPRASGMLIRSQLVSAWPSLVVQGSVTEAGSTTAVPLENLRDDRPAPAVRLCIFKGVPERVTLAEPYRGLRFGTEEGTIAPRYVSAAGPTGGQIPDGEKVAPSFREPQAKATGGVLEIVPLVQAMAKATGVDPAGFRAGDLAIQLVSAPELQAFPSAIAKART
jgi:hypothetical protein